MSDAEGSQVELALGQRRSLEQALADLRAKYSTQPNRDLARMIQQLETEITVRKRSPDER